MNFQIDERVVCRKSTHITRRDGNGTRVEKPAYSRIGVFKGMKNEEKAFVEFVTSMGAVKMAVPIGDISRESA